MYIPYIDPLIMALETRFSSENKPFYCLFELHPERMAKRDKARFMSQATKISNTYEIDNFMEEASIWFDVWENRTRKECRSHKSFHWNICLIDLLDQSILFPAVNTAIRVALCHTGNNLHYRAVIQHPQKSKDMASIDYDRRETDRVGCV